MFKRKVLRLHGGPVVKTSASNARGSIPDQEARSHMPLGQNSKTWNRSNVVKNSVKTLKMAHIFKNLKKYWKPLRLDDPPQSGCSFLVIKLTPVTSASSASPTYRLPQHHPACGWLGGSFQDLPHPRPDFPVTLWASEVGRTGRGVSQVGLQGEAHEMRVVSPGWGRGTSICPGLPSLLASLQSADRCLQDEPIEKGVWTWGIYFKQSVPTCSQWLKMASERGLRVLRV